MKWYKEVCIVIEVDRKQITLSAKEKGKRKERVGVGVRGPGAHRIKEAKFVGETTLCS